MNLYLDGDIIAYRAAASAEKPINWGDGLWTLHAFEDDVMRVIDDYIYDLTEGHDFTNVIGVVSDKHNFRKDVDSTYKSNRKDTRKPMLLGFAKDYLVDAYDGIIWKNLEADDVLGILVTRSRDNVIWSLDKDLMTCPGLHFIEGKLVDVEEIEADYWFYTQTLTGDATDGYAGCPKIGPKTAEKILGTEGDWWESVVSAYEKAGLTEEDALQQARLARILRDGEYNQETGEVRLWNPQS
jgi:DNA polymerase-1